MKTMTKTLTLQKQILERIKSQGVRPTAKGYFRARDYVLWLLIGVFVAALGVGASMVAFLMRGIDRGLYAKLGLTFAQKVFYAVPSFWIVATILVAAIAFVNFRRTRKGYRLSAKHIAVITIASGVAFGSIIYALDVSKYIDRAAAENIPLYNSVVPLNTNTWFDPDHGLLAGYVKTRTTNENFTLRDQNFDLWTVTGKDVSFSPSDFKFQSGDHIKIIGKKIGDLKFQVVEIRPWEIKPDRGTKTISP